jgi:hypothetical protein
MAAAKTGATKKDGQYTRRLDGKDVRAVMYNGKHAGHGRYIAGEVDGKLVVDASGKPLPLKEVGKLVPL